MNINQSAARVSDGASGMGLGTVGGLASDGFSHVVDGGKLLGGTVS